MRNNMVATLSEDYVRMARAKGLSSRRIMISYSARNAILPNLTGFAMTMGFILGGSILVEYIYSYQGLGYLFYQGTESRDLPLQQALFLFYTLAVLVFVLLADFLTAWLDPRTRDGVGERRDSHRRVPHAAAHPHLVEGGLSRVSKAILRNRKATLGLVMFLILLFVALFPDVITSRRGTNGPTRSAGCHRAGSAQLLQFRPPATRWARPSSTTTCSRSWSTRRGLTLFATVLIPSRDRDLRRHRRHGGLRRAGGPIGAVVHDGRVPGHPGAAAADRPVHLPRRRRHRARSSSS